MQNPQEGDNLIHKPVDKGGKVLSLREKENDFFRVEGRILGEALKNASEAVWGQFPNS